MTTNQTWTSNTAMLTYSRVLRWIVAEVGLYQVADADPVAAALGLEPSDVRAAFAALSSLGLVEPMEASLGEVGATSVQVRDPASARVAEWDAVATPAVTRRACRTAFLTWLDSVEQQQPSSSDDFLGTAYAHFLGKPFESPTVSTTATALLELGLIQGMKVWGDPIVRPRLTVLGSALLDQYDGDVSAWQAASTRGGTQINVTGSQNVNVASHSPGAQQTAQTITEARNAVQDVADALDAILASRAADLDLAPADLARAYALVPQLREAAAQVEADPEPARRRLDSLRTIFVAGSGSALGVGMVELAEHAAQLVAGLT